MLTELHPGCTVEQAVDATGWPLRVAAELTAPSPPSEDELRTLGRPGRVMDRLHLRVPARSGGVRPRPRGRGGRRGRRPRPEPGLPDHRRRRGGDRRPGRRAARSPPGSALGRGGAARPRRAGRPGPRAAASEADADVVVCLGGGSSTGLAKALALSHDLPILAVPTTYAGSEMTPIYGLTGGRHKQTGRMSGCYPRSSSTTPSSRWTFPRASPGRAPSTRWPTASRRSTRRAATRSRRRWRWKASGPSTGHCPS